MRKRFTRILAALALLVFMTPSLAGWGQTRETTTLFTETFNSCNGTGGNDGNWSGNIATGTLTADDSGWTFSNGNGANKCAKFGTGSKKGSAETSSISFTGDATLTFKAAAWNGSSEGTTLNLSATGGTLKQNGQNVSSVTLTKGSWTSYTVDVTNVTTSVKIKFEAQNASNNRFFLDEVVVTQEVSTDPSITVSPTAPETVPFAGGSVNFTITPANFTPSSYTLQFYEAATGETTTTKPSWIGEPSFNGNAFTLSISVNAGDERHAYFTVKSGDVESTNRVTLTQAEYIVTPPTLTAAANFDANKDVTITPASGTTVYYTTDNSTPSNSNGNAITAATTFNIKATTIVKAIAYDNNNTASSEVSATYTKTTNNISDISSVGSKYTIVGTVVAKQSGSGFILGDGTGYIYCYASNSWDIGDKVKINNAQIYQNTSYNNYIFRYQAAGSGNQLASNYEDEDATPVSGTEITAYWGGMHLSDYVQVEGVLTKTNGNYNIAIADYNAHVVRVASPTSDQSNTLTSLDNHKVRIKGYYSGFAGTNDDAPFTITFDDIEDIQPVVTASAPSLSGFTYNYGGGPSAAQFFTVNGNKLIGNLTVTASSNYKVCLTENGDYVSSVSLSPANGVVDNTTVYVRLKSGLSSGLYNSNDDKITVASTDAVTMTVALSGSVTHAITTGAHENGSLEVATAAAYNTTVSVTAAPASEYFRLSALTVTKTSDGSAADVIPSLVSGNEYSFTMPDYAITVSATYVPLYDITINNTTPTGGTVTAVAKAAEGENVSITIEASSTPTPGFELNTLVVKKDADESTITVTNNAFTMPAGSVTITASFIALRSLAYDKNGASVTGTAPVDANSPYRNGAEVTVLTKGDLELEGYDFSGWNPAANGSGNNNTNYAAGDKFTITENTTLYAQWTIANYEYTITKTGETEHATVQLKIGNDAAGATIPYNTDVTVDVTPESGYSYTVSVKEVGNNDVIVTDNHFTMPASTVTVTVAVTRNYIVNFMTNGIGDQSIEVVPGQTVSNFPDANSAYIPEGYAFMGWIVGNYPVGDDAPGAYIETPYTPEGNVTLNAVFAEVSSSQSATNKSYELVPNDFSGASYSANNGEKTIHEVVLNLNNVMKSDESIQFRKENGIMYNKNALGDYIVSVVIDVKSGTFVVYEGNDKDPSTTVTGSNNTYTFSSNKQYFKIANTSSTVAQANTITVNYVETAVINVYSNYRTSYTENHQLDITGYGDNNNVKTGWNLIASPVFTTPAAVTNMLSNTYDLYRFNQSASNDLVWENYKNDAHQSGFTITPGQGYLYANSNTVTLTFTGSPYNSNVVALAYDGGLDEKLKGLNLVGNPLTTEATVTKDYYAMNSTGSEVIASSGNIGVMQGIFVYAEDENDTEMTFTAVSRGTKSNTNSGIILNLSGNDGNVIDRAIVRFGEGQALPKFQLFESSTRIYITQDGNNYAVVRSNAKDEKPIYFVPARNGQYTINVALENVEVDYLHLIDNIAGTDIDLLATPSYTFNAKADDYESRFRLVFSANMVNADLNDDFAFFSNGQLVIANEGESLLQVIDVTGRVVAIENINGTCSKAINAKAGVYVLRLINGTDVKTQKIVIR